MQAAHLRDLNRRGDAEAVIRLYESGALQSTEAATGEYIKALVNVERLDTSRLMGTIQVRALSCGPAGRSEGSLAWLHSLALISLYT